MSGPERSISVEPRATLTWPDVLARMFGLGPLGFRQLNVLRDFGISNLPSGGLLISSNGEVAACASVIDNLTADPGTILAS